MSQSPDPLAGRRDQETVIEISGEQRRLFSIIGPIALAVGVLMTAIAILVDEFPGSLIVGFIAAVCLLLAGMSVLGWSRAGPPRKLRLDDSGLRWDEGSPEHCWQVSWSELAEVRLTVLTVLAGDGTTSRTYRLVDLYPAGSGFGRRHPELEPFWEADDVRGGYRLPKNFRATAFTEFEQQVRRVRPDICRHQETEGRSRPANLYQD